MWGKQCHELTKKRKSRPVFAVVVFFFFDFDTRPLFSALEDNMDTKKSLGVINRK